ncbi:MAG: hypothetical protein RSB57_00110 [Hungatella sp.]
MEKQVSFSNEFFDWVMTFVIVSLLSIACNIVGYGGAFIESLPGMLIFTAISLAGLTLKHFIPGNLPAVAYIALIGMVVAMPFSPVSKVVVYWANQISLMAVVTPILAYAGVIVGRDWRDFLKIGWKGIFVSLLVIFGTFFVSGGMAELLSKAF